MLQISRNSPSLFKILKHVHLFKYMLLNSSLLGYICDNVKSELFTIVMILSSMNDLRKKTERRVEF